MRIKELHIRNIASIERADIDFEHGLGEAADGRPAPIFLIGGDTGAGKSALLDAIALALYKKTPRLADVANKLRNEFVSQGESLSINSIEQYTRLGISGKDECYSEVLFTGNDGQDYRARLTLGMNQKRTRNESTGEMVLGHAAYKWNVKVGTADWQRVEAQTGQPLLDAIGLTFEQFGRMAMLAQGQFASFLVGDKREREEILEQLTNTEHFSRYGAAIRSLFGKAQRTCEQARAALALEAGHTLPDDELERLGREQQTLTALRLEAERRCTAHAERLRHIEAIGKARLERLRATDRLRALEARQASDDFRLRQQLIADWDATATERQRLADLRTALAHLSACHTREAEGRQQFRRLMADHTARRQSAETAAASVETQQAWLAAREARSTLYNIADVVSLRLRQYAQLLRKTAENDARRVSEEARTPLLGRTREEAIRRAAETAQAVDALQATIDRLTRERKALDPDALREQTARLTDEKLSLERLWAEADALESKRQSAERLQAEIAADTRTLERLRTEADALERAYRAARTTADKAKDRFVTMRTSLDETLVRLRKRLAADQAPACPLCGQPLAGAPLEQDFEGLLTPLEAEQKEREQACLDAEKAYREANSHHATALGRLQLKRKQALEADADYRRCAPALGLRLAEARLDPSRPIGPQIDEAVGRISDEVRRLDARQRQAGQLQADIDRQLRAKRPLDAAKSQADLARRDAENACRQNEENLNRLRQEAEADRRTRAEQEETLDASLAEAYPQWRREPERVAADLLTQADDYKQRKEACARAVRTLDETRTLLLSLDHARSALLRQHPDWSADPTAAGASVEGDVGRAWTSLLAELSNLAAERTSAERLCTECRAVLESYYRQTETDEAHLRAVEARGAEVEPARAAVQQMASEMAAARDAAVRADETIRALLAELRLADEDALPPEDDLQKEKDRLDGERNDLVGRLAAIRQRLDDNDRNLARRKEAERTLERADAALRRWELVHRYFGGDRFRRLVQTYVLRPLLNNANIYLSRITDRYRLTCSESNEQLSILVHDCYNKGQVRSATLLSGGERFMISLALSLALSSLNRPDMNVNILFIDEGFGTLDERSLDSVMATLEKLQEIAGQTSRRVGIISHRSELEERIPVQIRVVRKGEGRSHVEVRS